MVEGFCAVRKGKRIIFLRSACQGPEQERLAEAVMRLADAKLVSSHGGWRGRSGKLSVVRARLAGGWVVVRRFTHGGLLGGVLPELTLGKGRVLRELAVVQRAREQGVPTPAVVAASLRRTMGVFHQAHVITEEIAGACNLTEFFLRLPACGPELAEQHKRAVLEAVAKALAQMHDAGILHGDLHLRNILVRLESGRGESRAQAYLLDFDRARLLPVGRTGASALSAVRRLANLRRLMRSVGKVQPVREQFSLRDAVRFLRTYLGRRERGEIERWVKELSPPPRLRRAYSAMPGARATAGVPAPACAPRAGKPAGGADG